MKPESEIQQRYTPAIRVIAVYIPAPHTTDGHILKESLLSLVVVAATETYCNLVSFYNNF